MPGRPGERSPTGGCVVLATDGAMQYDAPRCLPCAHGYQTYLGSLYPIPLRGIGQLGCPVCCWSSFGVVCCQEVVSELAANLVSAWDARGCSSRVGLLQLEDEVGLKRTRTEEAGLEPAKVPGP